MNRERFAFVCQETEAGTDAFVTHPSTQEEGWVVDFGPETIVVKTSSGNTCRWDYRECEELYRSREEWPRR